MEQNTLAMGHIENAGLQSHGAARRNAEREMRHALVGGHIFHNAARNAHDLDRFARIIVGNIKRSFLDGLKLAPVLVSLIHDLRTADLEFEAFAAHGLHENRKVQHAAAGNAHAGLVFGFLDAHRDIGFLFAHQTLFKLSSADDIALSANDRAGRGLEHDGHRGLFNGDGRHFDGILAIGDHISDIGCLDADNGHDIARVSFGNLDLAKVLEGVHLANLGVVGFAFGRNHEHEVFLVNGAAMQAADTDAAFVAAMVDRAHLQGDRTVDVDIGSGDLFENRVEQRNHVHVVIGMIVASVAVYRRGVDDGKIELLVGSTELNHKVKHLVNSTFGICVGAVDLIHDDHDAQAALKRMGQNEASLRLGALVGVDDQQRSIGHVEHALNLAAEVSVARGVDDVDFHAFIVDGYILRQNRDAAFALLVVRVEHALFDLLILTKHMRRAKQTVDQRRFTVVNVRDDGNVAKVFLLHYSSSQFSSSCRFCISISPRCSSSVCIFLHAPASVTIPQMTSVPASPAAHTMRRKNSATIAPAAIMMIALRRSSASASR